MADHFYLEKIFPDSDKIFSFQHKSVDDVKDSCIYVLDTNVLLVPYLTGKESVKEYRTIFQKLKESKRLYIPERVAREFAKNRGQRIADTYNTILQSRQKLNSTQITIDQFPIFEANADYIRLREIESEINKLREQFRKKLDALSENLMNWTWDDPVSVLYRDIFTSDIIMSVKHTDTQIVDELKFRQEHQIPPGFKKADQEKVDGGIGDLVIWLTTLEIGKTLDKDVIFVTNESHRDWFYRHQNAAILPRYELIDEFRRYTGGRSVNLIDFSKFLTLLNASHSTVDEVVKVSAPEPTLQIIQASYYTDAHSLDITRALRAKIENNRLSTWANNDIAGDPHPGVVKKLDITYLVSNVVDDFSNVRLKIYNEHDRIELPE